MPLLDQIESPADLKKLSVEELKTLCGEIREYMISCCSKNPGHLGASLGAVELAVALHYIYNTPHDKLIWDVGHQAYAHKILTGRKEAFKTNRQYGGISGFPRRSESEYDTFGVGHASTSISAALGMAVAAKLDNSDNEIVAIIGDGAMTGGLAFEGLNNAAALKTDILVILNDNHISIDHGAGGLHEYLLKVSTSEKYNNAKDKIWDSLNSVKAKNFVKKFMFSTKAALFKRGSIFESLGFRYFGTIDGNNIEQLVATLGSLKKIKGPKLLHVITKKGKGYKPAEEDQVIWHAPGTFDPVTGQRTVAPVDNHSRFQDVFGESLLELARKNEDIVAITPAMATGCGMNIMMAEIPERTFDVGIAEQHAVTFSAGLAAAGKLPFCNIYSSFMQRAYDSVIHDVALQKLKVVFCLDRAGLVGEDGATHHGVFDLACFRPIPNLIIASPYDELELRNMMYSATLPEYCTTIIRYPRGKGRGAEWRNQPFTSIPIGKGRILKDGTDIAVLSIGPIGVTAAEAIAEAEKKGVSVMHCDMRFLKPIDKNLLTIVTGKVKKIITVEDGSLIGGLHSSIAEYLADNHIDCELKGFGVPDRFIQQGKISELRKDCGFEMEDILNELLK